MSRKEIAKVLITILFLFDFLIMYSCNKNSDESAKSTVKKNIHVVFNMNPATVEYKGTEEIPVFNFDPRDAMKKSLKEAGFRYEEFLVIFKGSSTSSQSLEAYNQKIKNGDYRPYDLRLVVTYVERARARSPYPEVPKRVTEEINTVGFSVGLYDDKDNRLLDEVFDRSMLTPLAANMDARVKFCAAIPQLIMDRLEAEDEVSYLLSRIQKEEYARILERGGGFSLIDQLRIRQDARAIPAILPFLRTGNQYAREQAKYALHSLGYRPQSVKEKAAWEIIDFEVPAVLNTEEMETFPWGIRRRVSGPDGLGWHRTPLEVEHFILYYGLDGIELLLEDLKFKHQKVDLGLYGVTIEGKVVDPNPIIFHAGQGLCLLSQSNWQQAWGRGYVDIDDYVLLEKIASLPAEEINRKLTSKIIKPRWSEGKGTIGREHFVSVFQQKWNTYATDSLIAALNDTKSKDEYLADVLYILAEIGNKRVIEALKAYLPSPSLSANVKMAIQKIESRAKS